MNHIFHQSMAPVSQKEYFYQWPYTVFGDSLDEVLILGAAAGPDVAAALRHGAAHVDAVDIDPVILRLGAERHPDQPYSDPRVDRRLRRRAAFPADDDEEATTCVVFALIDSLTVQSSFSGVRLESYMFTQESFEAVRDHLVAARRDGALQLFPGEVARRSPGEHRGGGLRPRAARPRSSGSRVSGGDAGRTARRRTDGAADLPADVNAYGQPHAPSPAHALVRDASVAPATDDWPFTVLRTPACRGTTSRRSGSMLGCLSAHRRRGSRICPRRTRPARRSGSDWSRHFFLFLGAGFMLLETKSIVQFALLWGSTWSSASLADRVGAGDGAREARSWPAGSPIRRRGLDRRAPSRARSR